MPRYGDLAVLVTTTGKTDYFTPCTCVQGNKFILHAWENLTVVTSLLSVLRVEGVRRQLSETTGKSIQWNLCIKDLRIKAHLSNQDTNRCPSYIEKCTEQPHLFYQDTLCGPKGVRNREVPLYVHVYTLATGYLCVHNV